MNAVEIDPGTVQLAGYMAPSVADAPSDVLREEMKADLQAIRVGLEQDPGWRPTKDGLLPDGYTDAQPVGRQGHARALERCSERVQAIRLELQNREQAAKAQHKAEKKRLRAELEMALDTGPKQARELAEKAEEVVAASARVRAFVRDLELMAGGSRLLDQHAAIQSGCQAAAAALGKEAPKLPAMPEGLPTTREVQSTVAKFSGNAGFDRISADGPNVARAAETARKYKAM